MGLEINHVLTSAMEVTDSGAPDFRIGVGDVRDKELDFVGIVSG